MNYSDFCKPFYNKIHSLCGLKGITAQYRIAEFFIQTALGEEASARLYHTDDLYRKWFTGTRKITDNLWEEIAAGFDEAYFCRSISGKLNKAALPDLLKGFGITGSGEQLPDISTAASAITEQFKTIMKGLGEGDYILDKVLLKDPSSSVFPTYINNAYKKYSKLKTLLYSSEERPFHEFFVCNTIRMNQLFFSLEDYDTNEVIQNVTLENSLQNLAIPSW